MSHNTEHPPDMDRLRWQCRRGMLELDEILRRYLETRYPSASEEEQAQFRQLLDIEDPVLNAWLLLGHEPQVRVLMDITRKVREG